MECKLFQILQLNAQKRIGVMHSVINDENLRDFLVLLISEPHVWRDNKGRAILILIVHNNWIKTEPTILNTKDRWVYHSMI